MLILSSIILVIALNVFLALLVLLRNKKNRTHQTFFLLTVVLGLWSAANYASNINASINIQMFNNRLAFIAAATVMYVLWIFSRQFLERIKSKKEFVVATTVYTASIAVMVTSHGIQGVEYDSVRQVIDINTGSLYWAYIASVVLLFLLVLKNLIYKQRTGTAIQKAQIGYILFGIAATFIWALITSAAVPAITGDWVISKFGPTGTLFLVGAIAYSIVRHRLFDIRLIVARSVAYTLLLGTLGLGYSFAIFGASEFFFAGDAITRGQQVVYAVLAVILAFTFQPLRRFFEKVTDKIFYRDRYETRSVINSISQILAQEIDIDIITRQTLKVIGRNLKLRNGSFVVMDENGKIYKVEEFGAVAIDRLDKDQLARLDESITITDELGENPLKHMLQEYKIDATLRLKTQSGVVGYLLLGPKESGSIYTNQDIELLEILSNELAVAVENARSFEKIADFNVTLQERIEEATKQLKVQNEKLKELDKAKDEFISMASHQLRTPLTTIKGYLSMLLEGDSGSELEGKQRDFTDLAYTSAQRMVYLISDMLNVSRISTGKLSFDIAQVDLEKIAKEEIAQLKQTADAKDAKLHFNPPQEKIPKLYLDEGKVRQVMMNFMDNAVYYAPKTTIEVYLENNDGKARFLVKDKGIGVPEEEQDKLFTKFYRATNAKEARPDGTGLGLYMAKMVTDNMGGEIIFESTPGKGSTFGFEYDIDELKDHPAPSTQKTDESEK